MKRSFIKSAFIIIIFSIIFIFSSNETFSCSECPDFIPPTEQSWNGRCDTVFIDFGYGPCYFYVCYCWRQLDFSTAPRIEIFICSILNLSVGNCQGAENLHLWDLNRLCAEELMEQNPGNLNWPCPDCSEPLYEYRAFWAACYDDNEDKCGVAGYCKYKYSVCCENGIRKVLYVSSEKVGDDCPDGCSEHCESPF